jgi:hypothetical protein
MILDLKDFISETIFFFVKLEFYVSEFYIANTSPLAVIKNA